MDTNTVKKILTMTEQLLNRHMPEVGVVDEEQDYQMFLKLYKNILFMLEKFNYHPLAEGFCQTICEYIDICYKTIRYERSEKHDIPVSEEEAEKMKNMLAAEEQIQFDID